MSEDRLAEEDENEKQEKVSGTKSLYEIIYKLKHNTDLNELIYKINQFLKNKLKKGLDEIEKGN